MGGFRIDLSKLDALQRAVDAAAPRILREVATQVVSIGTREFRQEGRLMHGGWAPLAPSTAKAKAAKKRGKKGGKGKPRHAKLLLHDTDTLSKSLSVTGDGSFGTPVRYASFHQYGTTKMPARPFPPFDADGNLLPEAERVIVRHVDGFLKRILPK